MIEIDMNHYVLLGVVAGGVTQATLDRHGVGLVENIRDDAALFVWSLVFIPLNILSNFGIIAISAWAFFELPWQGVVGALIVGFIAWSLLFGAALATFKRSESWYSIMAYGLPIQLILKSGTSTGVVFLVWQFLK